MKLRRSARTILATLLALTVFTLLTIWHNKASGSITEQEMRLLSGELEQKNPGLETFLHSISPDAVHPGFYVVFSVPQSSWPTSLLQASYGDPLARLTQNDEVSTLIRYRSLADLLLILDKAESNSPGFIASMNFNQVRVVSEPPITISLRLLISILLGGSGVWVVLWINRRTKNSGK